MARLDEVRSGLTAARSGYRQGDAHLAEGRRSRTISQEAISARTDIASESGRIALGLSRALESVHAGVSHLGINLVDYRAENTKVADASKTAEGHYKNAEEEVVSARDVIVHTLGALEISSVSDPRGSLMVAESGASKTYLDADERTKQADKTEALLEKTLLSIAEAQENARKLADSFVELQGTAGYDAYHHGAEGIAGAEAAFGKGHNDIDLLIVRYLG